jgi:sec-independent protein translocase protein TatC
MTQVEQQPARPRETFDPDAYRMTIGDHLEELRSRLLRALIGFVAAVAICFAFSERVIAIFCKPLVDALQRNNLNPQLYFTHVSDTFIVYIEMTLICGAVLAAPWILYQLWQFVAAGLYPRERKYITKYMPMSVALALAGVLVLYFLVLPLSLEFFVRFSMGLPLKMVETPPAKVMPADPLPKIPLLAGEPRKPTEGDLWIDTTRNQLKIYHDGETRVIPFGSTNLTAPMLTLPNYIDMVIQLLLAFGLSFQLPLVVLALERIGIVDVATLRKMRRYVYFATAVVAAFIIPDVVTGMLALMIPLIGLYELGIGLIVWGRKQEHRA